MAKECKKCLKKYDDTWGVCLLCGDKLKREDECRKACSAEGKDPGEELASGKSARGAAYLAGIALFIALAAYFILSAGTEMWTKVIERIFPF